MKFDSAMFWLAASCALTGLLWIPYVVNRIDELGPPGLSWFPQPDPPPRAAWAARAMRAHTNAVENLVVFAPLALAAHAMGQSEHLAALGCQTYFWARLAHVVVYVIGMPIVPRTLAFLVGVAAQMTLAWIVIAASV